MSVFQVNLNNFNSGGPIDPNAYPTAFPSAKTIYAMGPNRINRVLKDQQQFTDSNYWKRFAYPQLPLNQAWITVVSDDGSTWDDFHPQGADFSKGYHLTATAGTTYTTNVMPILSDTGSYAKFAQITNEGTATVKVRINGDSSSFFDLPSGATQVFNQGDLRITKIEFDASTITVNCPIVTIVSCQQQSVS